MNREDFSKPLSLRSVQITDDFWKKEMELVRNQMLPYQWDALNDQVEGAAPSYCMRNFKIAGKKNLERKELGGDYQEPSYTFRGFEALPKDPEHLEDKFYGFVFQDSDFYKWIEAVGYSLTQHPDPELEKTADGLCGCLSSPCTGCRMAGQRAGVGYHEGAEEVRKSQILRACHVGSCGYPPRL